MTIDDRKNFFMMGFSFALIGIYPRAWWFILAVIAIVLLFGFIMHRFNVVGGGDVNTFMWIIYGFAIIALNAFLTWFLVFAVLLVIYEVMKRLWFKERHPLPFYGVILISFVFACYILKLYF